MIKIGTSTKNQKQIALGTTQMQRVYVGDKLVWQKNLITAIKYGALYNWYAAMDVRNILNSGWHVPSFAELATLATYLGSSPAAKLKETGTIYWNAPNANATNIYLFNGRGSGYRNQDTGYFSSLKSNFICWSSDKSTNYVGRAMSSSWEEFTRNNVTGSWQRNGFSVRPIKDTTTLTNGQYGTYTGNDGKIYRTICINGKEYLADNLAETKFRDGSLIPFAGDNGINFTNAEWAALITPGCCAHNNDWSNVLL